ncbi:MAG: inositol monophosphatase family protein [Owenweeksia sp.]|nr:inositol monophosphatase family protein [Owenweeksia sp.]
MAPWDVAAGALLVKEAGGVVNDYKGGNQFVHGGEIVACTPAVESDFMDLIMKYLA